MGRRGAAAALPRPPRDRGCADSPPQRALCADSRSENLAAIASAARDRSRAAATSAASITLLSHSLTDLRDRRETGRAISSASGRRPLSFHGAPDFIRVQPTS